MSVLNVCAPGSLSMVDSYGLLTCQLARHLARLGHYVNVSTLKDSDYGALPPDIANAATRPFRKPHGTFYVGYPTKYQLHGPEAESVPRIAITMFESTRIPTEWPAILNELDGVIVPSRFLVDAFRQSGVTVPIHVVPLGIGDNYRYAERSADRPFTFIVFTDRGARKGWQETQQAFLMTFGGDTNYRLILKARTPRAARVTFTNPNIDAIQQDMTEQELYELYLQCDVMVSPNRGEGFGLIPREFCATGGIALATNWGGTADDIEQWGWPIPYALEKAIWKDTRFEGLDMGEWAKCDPVDVARIMKDVADNRDWYRVMAAQMALNVPQLYSWQSFAERAVGILEGVQVGERSRLQTA